MNQSHTLGVVLSRIDYGEADRILTIVTPDHGKLSLIARGVRKQGSRLAGGIELFSESEIGFVLGRGELATLTSARLKTHYDQIATDITRVKLGYELLKLLNRATEQQTEEAYFSLIIHVLAALNDLAISNLLVQLWFAAQLLVLAGQTPNLSFDTVTKQPLMVSKLYDFDYDAVGFYASDQGSFGQRQIKFLRLLMSKNSAKSISRISNSEQYLLQLSPLLQSLIQSYIV